TAAVPLLINEATAAGNFVNFISGGTVTNGVESGGTSKFSVSSAGAITAAGALVADGISYPTSLTAGYFLYGSNTTTIASNANLDDGITVASTLSYAGSGGLYLPAGSAQVGTTAGAHCIMSTTGTSCFSANTTLVGLTDVGGNVN